MRCAPFVVDERFAAMAVFGVYTVVHKGFEPVHFSPGDEVPEWAEDLVGDHCLADPVEESAEDFTGGDGDDKGESDGEDPADESTDDDAPADEPEDAPDFTKPTPRARK